MHGGGIGGLGKCWFGLGVDSLSASPSFCWVHPIGSKACLLGDSLRGAAYGFAWWNILYSFIYYKITVCYMHHGILLPNGIPEQRAFAEYVSVIQ